MVAYVAVSYTAKGAAKPALGTLKIEADTSVAVDERLVSFSDLEITESHFPTLKNDEVRIAVDEITSGLPREERVIALDRVLASVDKSQIIPKNVEGVKADPPPIFYSTTPRCSSTSTAIRSGARSRTTISSSPSTPTGICSSTNRPRASISATSRAG